MAALPHMALRLQPLAPYTAAHNKGWNDRFVGKMPFRPAKLSVSLTEINIAKQLAAIS
ncbi:hypothetical protein KUV46_00155 [Thalassovita mediterranea]|nr:hypothetical protein KUV46_00155 [Thalassovita mediterranea]